MSVDLMGMLKQAVGNQGMSKIGGLIGLDEKTTSKAFDGAAGSILGGLMKKSSNQQGIDQIFGAVQKSDGGLLDNLSGVLGDQQATVDLQKQGGGVLDMVFGGDRAKTESGIAQSLGLSGGIVGKLLTMAGPMLLGVIGRYVKSKALNAVGLGGLLGEQKSFLGNYMPSGLASNLGFSNFVDSGSAPVRTTASNAGRAATNTARDTANSGGGLMKMLLPLLLLAAIGWGLWQFVISPMMNAAPDGDRAGGGTVDNGENVNRASGELNLPGFDMSKYDVSTLGDAGPKLTNGMSDISAGFKNIATNPTEEAANGLVGTLGGFGDSLDNLNIGEMAGPAKETATGMLGQFSKTLETLLSKVPESLQGIVRPAVEGLIQKISSMGM